jgi:SynChlorMet cassette protein ScmD
MEKQDRPQAGCWVVLREEFDDWAVLFDPDTGHGFGLNPVGAHLWKLLDGQNQVDDLLKVLRRDALGVPLEAGEDLVAFIEELVRQGLATCEREQVEQHGRRMLPCSAPTKVPGAVRLSYELPVLVSLNSGPHLAHGGCESTGSSASCCSPTGNLATAFDGGCSATGVSGSQYCNPSSYCSDGCSFPPPAACCQPGGGAHELGCGAGCNATQAGCA